MAASLLVRPPAKSEIPAFRKGDTVRDLENAILTCIPESNALKLQLNAVLDGLVGHIGTDETDIESSPEPEPQKSGWPKWLGGE